MVIVGRRRSTDRAAVARALGHGEHDAIPEAIAQSAGPGESKRDLRVGPPGPTTITFVGLEENADSNHSRRNPTALGQPARFLAPTHQKRTRELAGGALCVRISLVLPARGRIHEGQAIVWC